MNKIQKINKTSKNLIFFRLNQRTFALFTKKDDFFNIKEKRNQENFLITLHKYKNTLMASACSLILLSNQFFFFGSCFSAFTIYNYFKESRIVTKVYSATETAYSQKINPKIQNAIS